jgi:superfamily II DNA or RNA helicase
MAYYKGLIIDSLKAIRKEANSGVRQRGAEIFNSSGAKLLKFDGEYYTAKFKIESQSGGDSYEVTLDDLDDPDAANSDCDCPSDYYPCKHAVAAAWALEKHIEQTAATPNTVFEHFKKVVTSPFQTIVPPKIEPPKPLLHKVINSQVALKNLEDRYIQPLVPHNYWSGRRNYQNVRSVEEGSGYEKFEVTLKKYGTFRVNVSRIERGLYHLSCSCNQELRTPLCEHQMGVLTWLAANRGIQALELLKDWTAEKDELLKSYGYSTKDTLIGKFDFTLESNGNLKLNLLDKSIQKIAGVAWETVWKSALPVRNSTPVLPTESLKEKAVYVYLFEDFQLESLPFFKVSVCKGIFNNKTGKITNINRLSWNDKERPTADANDLEILNVSALFNQTFFNDIIRERGFKLSTSSWRVNYTEEMMNVALEMTGKLLEKLFPLLTDHPVRWLKSSSYNGTSGVAITTDPIPYDLHFKLSRNTNETVLQAYAKQGDELVELNELTDTNTFWLILKNDVLGKFRNVATAKMARYFMDLGGAIRLRTVRDDAFFNGFVLPLANQFSLEFDKDQAITQSHLDFLEGRVYLKEDTENLLILPVFAYTTDEGETIELPCDFRAARIDAFSDLVQVQLRDSDVENEFVNFIRSQHPDFQHQTDEFFYLPAAKVLENGWLFQFYEALNNNKTKLFGFNALKKFKYNPNKASFKIRNASGIDWFDLKVEITFGDQSVSLADVRKAVLKKQNYIELKDGSFGLLPEEWLAQYSQLFKFGKVDDKTGTLRLSKQHFMILERYAEHIENPQLLKELADKRNKLMNFKEIAKIKLPKNVKANLRPYQEEGFKWLNFLDEFGWGGCLADDMGLGKTLQMLTFLQELKNRNPKGVHLVVMPKTLIFNWQAEAAKFCPTLRLYVHTGAARVKNIKIFEDYDIILSTYGSVRSDVELLSTFRFHYVVLDEAQAIKNPDSMISKAVKLLNTQGRLTMTGTPVENNTFDLYSQFDFLNPGFLGHQDFFRTEYANPIDKFQDKTQAAELRRMVYPFMLKRTKEEVAKDLPDKTETVLYCEMDKRQRKVYEAFKDKYRDMIEGKMMEVGREKAAFLILEGLLKLRQICDSPALLSDDEDYGDESVKLNEIVREIGENASNHKIVIFSQFLKMLDLIKSKLERDHIPYEYLDGQTQDRAERVNRFQGDQDCRVFLMSLKAGGVGLNLTEADYVYLVDPWWNPAVEQQAIDRVHRIGQTKRVFAYRMICKDTIEEKIQQLQNKKRLIADDLISTETGFLKKLTKDDILGLFS